MKEYEIMGIFKADMEDAARNEVIAQLNAIITNDGGEIISTDEEHWGLRDLAYEIDGMTKGYYVVTTFKATPAAVAELDRVARINSNIIRTMTLCLEDVEK